MRTRAIFAYFFVIMLPASALAANQKAEGGISANSGFVLSESRRAALVKRYYREHDAAAAYDLSVYYGFGVFDYHRQVVWLTRAARLGVAIAQYNLAFILDEKGTRKESAKARYWLNRAEKSAIQTNDHELLASIRDLRSEVRLERVR